MRVETFRFGTIEVDENRVLSVSNGLVGFPALTRFLLIDGEEGTPFKWLQSIEEPSLAFVVIDPRFLQADYDVGLTAQDAGLLDISQPDDLAMIVMITIPDDPQEMTANLMGPLVFNPENRRGVQLVLDDERYALRHRILPVASVE